MINLTKSQYLMVWKPIYLQNFNVIIFLKYKVQNQIIVIYYLPVNRNESVIFIKSLQHIRLIYYQPGQHQTQSYFLIVMILPYIWKEIKYYLQLTHWIVGESTTLSETNFRSSYLLPSKSSKTNTNNPLAFSRVYN